MSGEFPIQTPDGLTLVGRRWPVDDARRHGRAVLIHGVGEHSARYDEAAGVMNGVGIDVVSYDQRGFGKSPGDPGKIETEYAESHGRFSPDGRWIAYMSRESGQSEVFVRPFNHARPAKRVSDVGGGGWPRWRRDGKEIVYLALDNKLMAVAVDGDGAVLKAEAPRPLFPAPLRPMTRLDAYPYDIDADAQRFLLNTFVEAAPTTAITLVVNWSTGR